VIGEDPRIRAATPENIESILKGRYWYGDSGRAATTPWYRPLTTFSYLVNYAVLGNGPRPAGYHWVNLALHEVNVALVYALGVLVLGEIAPAWALAAIWGLHPLLTEAVTNIVGRADLLAAFGVLAGLLCHVKGASAAGRRRVAWLAGLAGAQAIGLFSKENAAVLPGIMLLYDLTWPERAAWRRRAAAYAAVALPFAAYLYFRSGLHWHAVIEYTENPLVSAGFWTTRLTAVKVIGKYLWLFVWPARLSADYTYNSISLFGWRLWNWEDAKAMVALAVCLGAAMLAVLLAVRWRRTGKPLLFFLVFFFVALSPTSNLIVLLGGLGRLCGGGRLCTWPAASPEAPGGGADCLGGARAGVPGVHGANLRPQLRLAGRAQSVGQYRGGLSGKRPGTLQPGSGTGAAAVRAAGGDCRIPGSRAD
jgi:hypothetical protein